MIFRIIVELLVAVTLIWFFGTQIIVPSLMGTKMFWLFRRTPAKHIEDVKHKIAEEHLNQAVEVIDSTLAEETKKTKQLKKKRSK